MWASGPLQCPLMNTRDLLLGIGQGPQDSGTALKCTLQSVTLQGWQALMTRSAEELSQSWAKQMCLGLALLFLGKQDATEATLEVHCMLACCTAHPLLGSVGSAIGLLLAFEQQFCMGRRPDVQEDGRAT